MARNGKRLGFLPGWRIFTYVILAINLIFLIWVIAGANSGNGQPTDCNGLDAQTCNDAQNAGTAIGVGLIIVLWAIVDLILGVLWLITNRKTRDCPVCGHNVKKGQMQCRNCGHDFRQQYGQQNGPQGPHGQGGFDPRYAQSPAWQQQGYQQGPPQGGYQQGPPQGPPPGQRPGPGPR